MCIYCGKDENGDAYLTDIAELKFNFGMDMGMYISPEKKKLCFYSTVGGGKELVTFEGDIEYCAMCGRKL